MFPAWILLFLSSPVKFRELSMYTQVYNDQFRWTETNTGKYAHHIVAPYSRPNFDFDNTLSYLTGMERKADTLWLMLSIINFLVQKMDIFAKVPIEAQWFWSRGLISCRLFNY